MDSESQMSLTIPEIGKWEIHTKPNISLFQVYYDMTCHVIRYLRNTLYLTEQKIIDILKNDLKTLNNSTIQCFTNQSTCLSKKIKYSLIPKNMNKLVFVAFWCGQKLEWLYSYDQVILIWNNPNEAKELTSVLESTLVPIKSYSLSQFKTLYFEHNISFVPAEGVPAEC